MSYRRESYTILRLNSILNGTVKVDQEAVFYLDQQHPVKYVKIYGLITDKVLDDHLNDSGKPDYLFKVDDGTGSVWVRFSGSNSELLQKWDFTRVLGRLDLETSNGKEFDVSIVGEGMIKVEDKNWEIVHVLESHRSIPKKGKLKPVPKHEQSQDEALNPENNDEENIKGSEEIQDSTTTESLTKKIERILRENDSGSGVEFSVILKMSGVEDESEVDDVLFELAYEGKVYQPRPDYYKIMD